MPILVGETDTADWLPAAIYESPTAYHPHPMEFNNRVVYVWGVGRIQRRPITPIITWVKNKSYENNRDGVKERLADLPS